MFVLTNRGHRSGANIPTTKNLYGCKTIVRECIYCVIVYHSIPVIWHQFLLKDVNLHSHYAAGYRLLSDTSNNSIIFKTTNTNTHPQKGCYSFSNIGTKCQCNGNPLLIPITFADTNFNTVCILRAIFSVM